MTPTLYAVLSTILVSIVSLVGIVLLGIKTDILKKGMIYLVSFSTGAIFGSVFLHLLPEIAHAAEENESLFSYILVGILLSFVVEKFIHWRHCHNVDCHDHVHPVGTLVLVGDAVHNVIDGILIATAYLVSIPVGIAATIAVLLHEIPQEFGNFAVLVHSGYTRKKALYLNFLSALTALLGAAVVLIFQSSFDAQIDVLLAIVAGNFLYIAGSDLIPELHRDQENTNAWLQLLAMIAGIALMMLLGEAGGHSHI